jgi:vanillate/3-O-methylgallate O-demethylase
MFGESLEQKIQRAGSQARMLRTSPVGHYPFPMTSEYTNWRDEQEAWMSTAILFDQSFHMTDVYFKGPGVKRLLSDVGVNSFATFGRNKAKQFVACNRYGHVIGDAILFGLAEDEVSLVGTPGAPDWLAFQVEAGGYEVEVTRDERTVDNKGGRLLFRYQLQGPNALKIVEKAHGGPVEHIKFFNIGEFTIAGCMVRALNHTMTGVPGMEMTGLEMTGPTDQGPAVMDALLEAGSEFGLRQGGAVAYSTTAIETGWIGQYVPAIYTGEQMKPYREWLSADSWEANASLGGSFTAENIEDYYLTPWELGFGRIMKFDHDFIGRSALEKLADQPHRKKVWLRWNDDDVTRVIASSLFGGEQRAKYLSIPNGMYVTWQYDQVLVGDQPVGLSNRTGYTVNLGSWCSLAMVDEAYARDDAEVTVVWGEEDGGAAMPTIEHHVQTEIRATVHTQPFV